MPQMKASKLAINFHTLDSEEPHWFVLYKGESEDGRGHGIYAGRTNNPTLALGFFRAYIKNNPYSTGHVTMFTNFCDVRMDEISLKQLIKKDEDEKPRNEKPKPEGYGAFA